MSMNPELLKDFDDRTVDECPLCEHEVARGEMGIHIEAAHRTDLQEMRTETADKVDPIIEQPTEPAAVDVKPADVTPKKQRAPRTPSPKAEADAKLAALLFG